jgi:NNP family nitrate/nitrite transporter-like MFS transporter
MTTISGYKRFQKRSNACVEPEYGCIYCMFRRLDDFFDYRRTNQSRYGVERYAVQPSDRHADPDRVAYSPVSGDLGRSVWRQADIPYGNAFVGSIHMVPDLCRYLHHAAADRIGGRDCRGSFVVGISYLSKWYSKERQGTALGVYGMGNIGAAATKFIAPFVMVAYGWHAVAQIWAVALFAIAVIYWFLSKDEPDLVERRKAGTKPKSTAMALAPLKKLQVWRFSLYYFFVFGAFVALALWLPRYYVGAYGMDIKQAGMLAAAFSVAGSLFRAVGGYLSDTYGARRVMYWTFSACVLCCFILSYPATDYVVHGIRGDIAFSFGLGFIPFTVIIFILGFFMSMGKAAIYKHIPVYYPDNVGSVAGIVGLIGGLGGFFLPICFGILNDLTNVWTSCFMLLFLLVSIALTWMHFAIRHMEKQKHPTLREPAYLPELGDPKQN